MARLVPANRFLVQAAYAEGTMRKYVPAVSDFISWCDPSFDPQTPEAFDNLLTDYIHFLYEFSGSRSKAQSTFYGILFFLPQLNGHLHFSSLSLKGWQKLHPSISYPPLTWELSCLIALRLSLGGFFSLALGTLLAFDGLLRINELLHLRKEDIADAGDGRLGFDVKAMALRIRSSKTGPNQWVTVSDPVVRHFVRELVRVLPPDALLFPVSAQTFRVRFKTACSQLRLSAHYVPHSLRHGGATRLHLAGVTLEDIMLRGRWASSHSARRYIQSGPALLLANNIAPSTASKAAITAANLKLLLTLSQTHTSGGRYARRL
jgi:hypothetical protein